MRNKHSLRKRKVLTGSGLPSPWSRYSPKQWMNYLTNLTNTYNPFTTLGGSNSQLCLVSLFVYEYRLNKFQFELLSENFDPTCKFIVLFYT